MPKRLAITIAGAVSLGSYEAGVLVEILNAIAGHNTNTSTALNDRICIDVMTGASAGGMSATILAQKLLFEGGSLGDPSSNSLHNPWINDISLKGLLQLTAGDNPTHSLFSSQLIESISRTYITDRYANGAPPAATPHPSIDPSKPLKLGLALSNLDGIDYAKPLQTRGQFVYTRYQDQYLREYSLGPASDNFAMWEDARNAAVSCGAFPFAFAVKALQRTIGDFANPVPSGFPPLNLRFTYTDGGVFQNEPLGMAKNFVDAIDNHLDSENRFYLFVAPGTKDTTISKDPITDANADLFTTAKALVGSIYYQARFHDWIMAEEMNTTVGVFNKRAEQLMQALLDGTVDPGAIGPASQAFFNVLKVNDPVRINDETVADARERLRKQFATEIEKLSGPGVAPGSVDVWLNSILVFELAADLGLRDEMNILAVTASESELAGSSLFAFAGFFDRKIRQHDYDVGRLKAQQFILAQNALPAGAGLGPFNYTPGSLVVPDPAYASFDPSKLDQGERTQLMDRFVDRANELLQETGINAVVRWGIVTFFIKPKLKTWLAL